MGRTWVKVGENRCEIGVSIEVKQGWKKCKGRKISPKRAYF